MYRIVSTTLLAGLCLLWKSSLATPAPHPSSTQPPSQLFFEENRGQYASGIHFQASLPATQVRFLSNGVSFARMRELHAHDHHEETHESKFGHLQPHTATHEGLVWNLQFLAPNESRYLEGAHPQAARIHYLPASDPAGWATDVRRFQELWYRELYPGIDLHYYGTSDHRLKYDFILQPGAEVSDIQLAWEGVKSLAVNAAGELEVETAWGTVVDAAPYAYQLIHGQAYPVACRYQLHDQRVMGFAITGPFHPDYPLVIDPLVLNWSTYLHSSTSDDYAMAVDVDEGGHVYVSGYSKTATFPTTPGVYQHMHDGALDTYVAKFQPGGTDLVFATYVGGSDWDMPHGLAINARGEAFVAGFTRSEDFPATAQALQPRHAGGMVEAFAYRLGAEGDSLVYSTYLGGTNRDYLYDLALNEADELFVTGFTFSSDFPSAPGTPPQPPAGNGDLFVAQLNAAGSALLYSQLVGGSGLDMGQSIALNEDGQVFVAGRTGSPDFPTTDNAYQPRLRQQAGLVPEDAIVLRLDLAQRTLLYATYLGGSDADMAYGLDVNDENEAFLTGNTLSTDFPTSMQAFVSSHHTSLGNGDVFVARLNAQGTQLIYGTYLGGSEMEFSKSIAVDPWDQAYVLGSTRSPNFPVTESEHAHAGMYDVFIAQLQPNGQLQQSDWLGGALNEYPRAAGALHLQHGRLTLGITTHSQRMLPAMGGFQSQKTNGSSDCPTVINLELGSVLAPLSVSFQAGWNRQREAVSLQWHAPLMTSWALERRTSGQPWKPIHAGLGAGGSQATLAWDPEARLFPGQALRYRLSLQQPDGSWRQGPIQEVVIPMDQPFHCLVAPNPANTRLRIQLTGPDVQQCELRIVDELGRLQHRLPAARASTAYLREEEINLQAWPRGRYFLLIYGPGISFAPKQLIVH